MPVKLQFFLVSPNHQFWWGAEVPAVHPPSRSGMLCSPQARPRVNRPGFSKDCYFTVCFVVIATYTYSKRKQQACVSVKCHVEDKDSLLCQMQPLGARWCKCNVSWLRVVPIFLRYDIHQPVFLGPRCLPVIACMKEVCLLAE